MTRIALRPWAWVAFNVEARIAASVGELESAIAPDFQLTLDVPNDGVLFALRALLAVRSKL